tara:strand:- start:175 stop:549 length:375 start_codon:yes stop_codon:yes gene_type:complete
MCTANPDSVTKPRMEKNIVTDILQTITILLQNVRPVRRTNIAKTDGWAVQVFLAMRVTALKHAETNSMAPPVYNTSPLAMMQFKNWKTLLLTVALTMESSNLADGQHQVKHIAIYAKQDMNLRI